MNKKAFTLIELIFGMVLAAIIAMGGAYVLQLNAGLIKKATILSESDFSMEGVTEHVVKNIRQSAWVEVKDKNTIILYSHSFQAGIRKYTFAKNTIEYSIDDGAGKTAKQVLARNVDSTEMFKGLGTARDIVAGGSGRNNKCYKAVQVIFYPKTSAPVNKTTDKYYERKYIKCMENWDLVYVDESRIKQVKNGAKQSPFGGQCYLSNGYSSGYGTTKIFILSGKITYATGLNGSIYVCKGAEISLKMIYNNAMHPACNGDAHFVGAQERKAVCGSSSKDGYVVFEVGHQNRKYMNYFCSNVDLAHVNLHFDSGKRIVLCDSYVHDMSVFAWDGWDGAPNVMIYNNLFVNNIRDIAFLGIRELEIHDNTFIYDYALPHQSKDVFIGDIWTGSIYYGMNKYSIYNNTFSAIGGSVPYAVSYNTGARGECKYAAIYSNKFINILNPINITSYHLVYDRGEAIHTVHDNDISYNVTCKGGCGIYLNINNSGGYPIQTLVYNNTIDGGGYINDGIRCFSHDVKVSNNYICNLKGNGIQVGLDESSMINGRTAMQAISVQNNHVGKASGYGIMVAGRAADVIISNNLMFGNKGLSIRLESSMLSNLAIENITLTDGIITGCDYQGHTAQRLWIKNCIFWGNITVDAPLKPFVSYSDINNLSGFTGEGIINREPLFVDTMNNNFKLQSRSPCKNLGENGSEMGAYGGPGAAGWEKGVGCQGPVGNVKE